MVSVSIKIGSCLTVKDYQTGSDRENSIVLTKDLQKSLQEVHGQNSIESNND